MQLILVYGKDFRLNASKIFNFVQRYSFMKRILLTCLTLTFFSITAHASNTNEAGTQTLKKAFQNLLDYQKKTQEAFGTINIDYGGNLTVTREPTFYTITFPRILISEFGSQETEEKTTDEIFEIGSIIINAMPDEKEGYWKTVITLPDTVTLGAGQADAFTIKFGEQRTIGLFNERLGYFTKFDMNLSALSFSFPEKETGISLGGFQFYSNMDEDEEQKFSGPGHVTLSNLVIAPPEKEETLQIKEIKTDFSMTKAFLPTIQEYQAKLLKHSETMRTLQGIDADDKEQVASSTKAIPEMISDLFYNFNFDAMSFTYSAKNIVVTSDKPSKAFSLGSGHFGLGISGVNKEKGGFSIKAGYKDIKSEKAEKDLRASLPAEANLNLKAINIPYTALSQIAQSTLSAVSENPDAAQMAAMGMMMRLPAVLGQAETKIILENNGLKNEIYDLNINGDISTDLTSIIGFAAKFNAMFEGLDALISAMQPSEGEEALDGSQSKLVESLRKWKAAGKEATGPNGKPAHSFDLETSPTGQMLVNGVDINEILR